MICVIPARAGSKRVPNKNKRTFLTSRDGGQCGLTEWTFIQAMLLKRFTTIYVTSDDQELLDWCKAIYDRTWKMLDGKHPAVFWCKRPDHLATDDASVLGVIEDLNIGWSEVVLMQPTSPFRRVETFNRVLLEYRSTGKMIATGMPVPGSFLVDETDDEYAHVDYPAILTGGWYVYPMLEGQHPNTAEMKIVSIEDSIEAIDIDTWRDWELAKVYADHILNRENISPYLGFDSDHRDFIHKAVGL